MVAIDDITEKELDQLHQFYVRLSALAEKEDDLTCTHSIDAAEENHLVKFKRYKNSQTPRQVLHLLNNGLSNKRPSKKW